MNKIRFADITPGTRFNVARAYGKGEIFVAQAVSKPEAYDGRGTGVDLQVLMQVDGIGKATYVLGRTGDDWRTLA